MDSNGSSEKEPASSTKIEANETKSKADGTESKPSQTNTADKAADAPVVVMAEPEGVTSPERPLRATKATAASAAKDTLAQKDTMPKSFPKAKNGLLPPLETGSESKSPKSNKNTAQAEGGVSSVSPKASDVDTGTPPIVQTEPMPVATPVKPSRKTKQRKPVPAKVDEGEGQWKSIGNDMVQNQTKTVPEQEVTGSNKTDIPAKSPAKEAKKGESGFKATSATGDKKDAQPKTPVKGGKKDGSAKSPAKEAKKGASESKATTAKGGKKDARPKTPAKGGKKDGPAKTPAKGGKKDASTKSPAKEAKKGASESKATPAKGGKKGARPKTPAKGGKKDASTKSPAKEAKKGASETKATPAKGGKMVASAKKSPQGGKKGTPAKMPSKDEEKSASKPRTRRGKKDSISKTRATGGQKGDGARRPGKDGKGDASGSKKTPPNSSRKQKAAQKTPQQAARATEGKNSSSRNDRKAAQTRARQDEKKGKRQSRDDRSPGRRKSKREQGDRDLSPAGRKSTKSTQTRLVATPSGKKVTPKSSPGKGPDRAKPKTSKSNAATHFICIPVYSKGVRGALASAQDRLISKAEGLEDMRLKPSLFNVALALLRIPRGEIESTRALLSTFQFNPADKSAKSADGKQTPSKRSQSRRLAIRIQGMQHYKGRVAYARVFDESGDLAGLAESLIAHFRASPQLSAYLDGIKQPHTPHVKLFKQRKSGVPSGLITDETLSEYKDAEFGLERNLSVELCSLRRSADDDFYPRCWAMRLMPGAPSFTRGRGAGKSIADSWIKLIDERTKVAYYYNKVSHETTWEAPKRFAIEASSLAFTPDKTGANVRGRGGAPKMTPLKKQLDMSKPSAAGQSAARQGKAPPKGKKSRSSGSGANGNGKTETKAKAKRSGKGQPRGKDSKMRAKKDAKGSGKKSPPATVESTDTGTKAKAKRSGKGQPRGKDSKMRAKKDAKGSGKKSPPATVESTDQSRRKRRSKVERSNGSSASAPRGPRTRLGGEMRKSGIFAKDQSAGSAKKKQQQQQRQPSSDGKTASRGPMVRRKAASMETATGPMTTSALSNASTAMLFLKHKLMMQYKPRGSGGKVLAGRGRAGAGRGRMAAGRGGRSRAQGGRGQVQSRGRGRLARGVGPPLMATQPSQQIVYGSDGSVYLKISPDPALFEMNQ